MHACLHTHAHAHACAPPALAQFAGSRGSIRRSILWSAVTRFCAWPRLSPRWRPGEGRLFTYVWVSLYIAACSAPPGRHLHMSRGKGRGIQRPYTCICYNYVHIIHVDFIYTVNYTYRSAERFQPACMRMAFGSDSTWLASIYTSSSTAIAVLELDRGAPGPGRGIELQQYNQFNDIQTCTSAPPPGTQSSSAAASLKLTRHRER